jgi:hypothetical protein
LAAGAAVAVDEDLDVVMFDPCASQRPIRDAAALMQRAALVVGVHGAGLSNVLFASLGAVGSGARAFEEARAPSAARRAPPRARRTALLELATRSPYHRHFFHASAALGVEWWAFTDVPDAAFDAAWELEPYGVRRVTRTALAALRSVGALVA